MKKADKALSILVGKPLTYISRAGSMLDLGFGGKRLVETKRGNKEVSEWVVHVDTDWRILIEDKVIVSSRLIELCQDENPKDNWFSDIEIEKRPKVSSINKGRHFADFTIELENGISVCAFATATYELDDEYWRVFQPFQNLEHVVMRVSGAFIE